MSPGVPRVDGRQRGPQPLGPWSSGARPEGGSGGAQVEVPAQEQAASQSSCAAPPRPTGPSSSMSPASGPWGTGEAMLVCRDSRPTRPNAYAISGATCHLVIPSHADGDPEAKRLEHVPTQPRARGGGAASPLTPQPLLHMCPTSWRT